MTQVRLAVDQAIREEAQRPGGPRAWGQPLDEDEWDLLIASGQVTRLAQNQATIEEVSSAIIAQRRTYRASARAPKLKGPSAAQRDNLRRRLAHNRALSVLLVAHLEQDDTDSFHVRAFRRRRLSGTLVTDLWTWLQTQVHRQGRPTIENGRLFFVIIRIDEQIIRRATRRGRTLDQLRVISEQLAAFYRWPPADAATYVLTGIRPTVHSIDGSVQRRSPIIARSTVTLTIDPTATPGEVAAAYSRLRTDEFPRVRRLTDKYATLAAFTFRHQALEADEQMGEWNGTYPGWRYQFPSVFQREAVLALGSLKDLRPHRSHR